MIRDAKGEKNTEQTKTPQKQTFELGPQPNWAGTDACVPQPSGFISSVLSENITALNRRGYPPLPFPFLPFILFYFILILCIYAIIELSQEVSDNYTDFHSAFEAFSQSTIDHKKGYATQQFDSMCERRERERRTGSGVREEEGKR